MHIDFKEVTLHNFLSFGDAHFSFEDDGFILVSGKNEFSADMATSNGSGKSSIWESIVWALTGETIRGTKQVGNIFGSDGTYVELAFKVDSTEYKILRSKDHSVYKTNLKLSANGVDFSGKGIRESEKLLSDKLPDLTASLLGSVIILGQGLPQKFTNNTPSGRKEVLEKLSKSDFMIEDLKQRVQVRKTELTKELRASTDKIIELTSKRDLLEHQIHSYKDQLATMDASDIKSQIESLTSKRQTIEDQISSCEVTRDNSSKILEDCNRDLNNLTSNYNTTVQDCNQRYQPDIDNCNKDSYQITSEIRSLEARIQEIRNIRDICPTCGQKIPGVIKPDTSDQESRIQVLKETYSAVCTQLKNLKATNTTELESINQKYKLSKQALTESITNYSTQLSQTTSSIKNLTVELNQLNSRYQALQIQLTQFDSMVETLQKSIQASVDNITEINNDLLYINSTKDIQQSHLDVINKFDTALKREFRGYLLSTVIDYIQERAKSYSFKIFETENLKFELDGNNIEISYMDKSYENLSGGEKQKVDLIVQFSIRDLLCSHLGFTSNILVLDEVFDALDMIGCQKVLDVISALKDTKNIFIVTHRKDLSIPCDREITVVKTTSGISEIET